MAKADPNKKKEEKSIVPVNTYSRRNFLKLAGTVAAAAGSISILSSCEAPIDASATGISNDFNVSVPVRSQYWQVPYAPTTPPPADQLLFFTPQEARTVDALVGRILPGTPQDPGAREAGVVNYIDKMLGVDDGFAEATYREAPFAETYDAGQTSLSAAQNSGYNVIWIAADQIKRYGYQSILTPREVYRIGVAAVNVYAHAQYEDTDFVDLTAEQQDQIVQDMLDNKIGGFEAFTSEAFFHVLRRHVSEGMFSDPAYGGNHDMVGWKLIGYPGAQRAYLPDEITQEGTARAPQSLAMMHAFNPGENVNPHIVAPVSGSNLQPTSPSVDPSKLQEEGEN